MDDVIEMRQRLGIADAPVVRAGLGTACRFFRHDVGVNPHDWTAYFRGIDFHHPVRVDVLARGTRLTRHLAPSPRAKPFAYFTVPGTSPTRTGTSFSHVEYQAFVTTQAVRALVSVATPISFNDVHRASFDPVSRMGGGTQFVIAERDVTSRLERER
jgi:hypothetical protein